MTKLRLTILRVDQTCSFRLSWGKGQQLQAELPLLQTLLPLYQTWQQTYLRFYQSLPLKSRSNNAPENLDKNAKNDPQNSLRGRVGNTGTFREPTVDWRVRLAQAETHLLTEFYRWLASAELLEIRQKIVELAAQNREANSPQGTSLFLDCNDIELSRLPWETWELGAEVVTGSIQIARTPSTLRESLTQRRRPGKMRMLVILGDAGELSFSRERQALGRLRRWADIEWLDCYQQGRAIADIKADICEALTHPQGWDILFFGGHSNETNLTGGELSLSPQTSILLKEIEPQLRRAKQQGLKFALFNSCKGISLANRLLDLGLSQVAVMREPIHNDVAEDFLVAFVEALARREDAHQAMHSACEFLKLKREMTYPSAALIPSLFRHPESTPFRLEPFGWKQRLGRWRPKKREAIALGVMALLSLMEPVQTPLLDWRTGLQAVYRHRTGRVAQSISPPTLLIQIDDESLKQGGVEAGKRNPIDRSYLAAVLRRAHELEPQVIGVDYILEDTTSKEDDEALKNTIQNIAEQPVSLVFASEKNARGGETGIHPQLAGDSPLTQGYLSWFYGYMALPETATACQKRCPFSYVLMLAAQQLDREQVQQTSLSAIARWAGRRHQPWLYPIWDLSIPPEQVYDAVTDAALQRGEQPQLKPDQIVLIVPGGYEDAGVDGLGLDNYELPVAVSYWQSVGQDASQVSSTFTGAEAHAYMIHHLMNRYFVWAVPDLWLILLAGFLGRWSNMFQKEKPLRYQNAIIYSIYVWFCLESYLLLGVLIPFLLPSLTFYGLTRRGAVDP